MEQATPAVEPESTETVPTEAVPQLAPLQAKVPDTTDPLRQCADEILKVATGTSKLNALEFMVELKRTQAFLKSIEDSIREHANAEFATLQADEPEKRQWNVHAGQAVVKRTTPRSTWQFPESINKLDRDLRAAKKASQIDGTATKLHPIADPASTTMFSVTLSEQFVTR
jgi:hypothetical protein